MAVTTRITPGDIAVGRGRAFDSVTPIEAASWGDLIDEALYLIAKRATLLGVDPSTLDSEDIDYVVKRSVIAHLSNPDDATQVTVAVDDGSTSRTYRSGPGRVEIVDEWWDLLFPALHADGAFTVTPYFEPDPVISPWPVLP